jgi:hypothetical protein
MNKILKYIIKNLSNIITLFNNFLKKLEILLAEDNLILIRTTQNTLGKKNFYFKQSQTIRR